MVTRLEDAELLEAVLLEVVWQEIPHPCWEASAGPKQGNWVDWLTELARKTSEVEAEVPFLPPRVPRNLRHI